MVGNGRIVSLLPGLEESLVDVFVAGADAFYVKICRPKESNHKLRYILQGS